MQGQEECAQYGRDLPTMRFYVHHIGVLTGGLSVSFAFAMYVWAILHVSTYGRL